MKYINIFLSLLQKNKRSVIIQKILLRFFDKKSSLTFNENVKWLNQNSITVKDFCKKIDHSLWSQIQNDLLEIKSDSSNKMKKINIDLGGGGSVELLYFLVRYVRPSIVVETGVAAGYSSYSILYALEKNQFGNLYSSDFPYFRIKNPEKYIGILVPEHLKKRWLLFIEGDKKNLVKIKNQINKIDLFHYDSDKSYIGRKETFETLSDKLEYSWTVIDDIQDNSFFFDLSNEIKNSYYIIKYKNKWIGVIRPRIHKLQKYV